MAERMGLFEEIAGKIGPFLVIAILLIVGVYALQFSSNPDILPDSAYSDDDLVCSWEASADTTQMNVTWYREGVLFFQNITSANESTISYLNTSKNEDWTCNVTISNATSTTYMEDTVSILNSAPTPPRVYDWNNTEIVTSVTLYEDQTYSLDINSSDVDDDEILYSEVSETADFCSVTNSATGAVSCSPTNSDLDGVNTTGEHNITFNANDQDPFYPYSSGKTIQFDIIPVNDEPSFDITFSDRAINETEIFNYYLEGSDEENNFPLNFTVAVAPYLNLITNKTSNTTAMIMFPGNRTASYSEAGNYTVNVTLYDSLGANITESFELNISQVNKDPVLANIGVQNGTQGGNLTFNVSATDIDEGNVLNFSIEPQPGTCSLDNPWTIETTNSSQNATGLVNVSILSNTHVVCRNVRIRVDDDRGGDDYQDVFLNITNVNDAPVLYDISSYSGNTVGDDITNLTGYAQSPFVYLVNASDIDELTYEGDVLNYSNEGSLFNINWSTGLVEFTPAQNQTGNFSIRINVTDDDGLSDSRLMNISIKNNSAPVLNPISNISCVEDSLCFFGITASDADGDNLSFTANNTEMLNLTNNESQNPIASAYLNQTYTQNDAGEYEVVITVSDEWGATDNQTVWLIVNNTNDAPEIVNFTFPKIVETHAVEVNVQANDDDYLLPDSYANISVNGVNVSEYLTFNDTNLTGGDMFNISTVFNSSSNMTYGRISFTPDSNDAGNYSVNITVTDNSGATASLVRNFTILQSEDPPNITHIRPYGLPYSQNTGFDFLSTDYFSENRTLVNFSENRTVVYEVNVTDDHTAAEDLNYTWYVDGVFSGNGTSINVSYDFFSNGTYNVSVYIEDERFEVSRWLWNITVDNLNRPPKLMNNLTDINGENAIQSQSTFYDYLKKYPDVKFIDPDDDIDGDGEIDGDEVSRLSYAVDSCSVATITISNHSLIVAPISVGFCNVSFRAIDSDNEIKWSNPVIINVTDVETEQTIVYVTTTRTNTKEKEVRVKEEVPKAIEVVIPDIILAEENTETEIPITLRNNWDETISGIYVSGTANVSGLGVDLDETYVESLSAYGEYNLTGKVSGNFGGSQYEVVIGANVSSPSTSDYAKVIIKRGKEGSGDGMQNNIIFAQDLLSKNPECLELNSMLEDAKDKINKGDTAEASQIIDGVVNGCQYMMSLSEKEVESPKNVMTGYINDNLMKYLKILVGLIVLSVVSVFVLTRIRKKRREREEEEEDII